MIKAENGEWKIELVRSSCFVLSSCLGCVNCLKLLEAAKLWAGFLPAAGGELGLSFCN